MTRKKKEQETLEHIFSDFKLHDQLSIEFETVGPSKRSTRTHEVQHFPPKFDQPLGTQAKGAEAMRVRGKAQEGWRMREK